MNTAPSRLSGLAAFLLLVFSHPPLSAFSDDTWSDRLQQQIDQEEQAQGRAGHRQRVDAAMNLLMDEIAKGTEAHGGHAGGPGPFTGMSMMQQMDGQFYLGATQKDETVVPGGRCPNSAPRREFDISAINVENTLNQWMDHHPGYMYVLTENLKKVRKEEQMNAEAREAAGYDPGAVSTGLQTDWIQPLTIRANQGDCVVIILRNHLDGEETSLHLHGSSLIIRESGRPATMANAESIDKTGGTLEYEWYIRPDESEGSHPFHSHVGRNQMELGLIGALIVEPMGSLYLDPLTGRVMKSGWQAMIAHPAGPDFREFVIFYHEVGDKSFRTLNKKREMTAQRDPYTDAYDTGRLALNYRSEPFGFNNLGLQEKYFNFTDESLSYSGYTFGDPPTPLPRSYLGDPAKFRLIHGGSETFHSHHPHGGTIRWLRQPQADSKAGDLFTAASNGPVKYPLIRTTSDRVDVQVIGPSEALDLETECGSGLCQQLAGDFLYHCHVAHHYVGGMWGYWRVYNTLQTGNYPYQSTDPMPPLQELPDRKGRMKPAVTSDELVGRTMDWYGKQWTISEGQSDWAAPIPNISIKDWVRLMLPPMGQPGHTADERGQIAAFDATVWDWTWEGNRAMGEPEATGTFAWPKYKSPMPGKRPPILFDLKTGKLAWPIMKPHFGKRMPFAPNHGPAPWLEPIHMEKTSGAPETDPGGKGAVGEPTLLPAKPGEQGRWSLCPENAGRKQFTIHFIETPITLNESLGNLPPVTDEHGLIYVLQDEEDRVRATENLKRPLVYRANVYDCVDLILKSEWVDNDHSNFQMSKVNIHPHFVQFDNQASDGVITGFSYEQSVRPFTQLKKEKPKGLPTPMNAVLTEDASSGQDSIRIRMAEGATVFHPGTELMVGMDEVKTSEVLRIKSVEGDVVFFTESLRHHHKKNEIASVEFVRYRYWVDADIGTVFWHDHAMGILTWPHGAVGAMIVEQVGSTYHDPETGSPVRSGPIADIHSTEPVGYGVNGSFREMVVMPHDTIPATAQIVSEGNPPQMTVKAAIDAGQTLTYRLPYNLDRVAVPMLNGGTHTTGGGLNLRAESVARRLIHNPDPAWIFSSIAHGRDPSTPLFKAYLGDTLVFRLLHTMMNETHAWHIAGHAFRSERYAEKSNLRNVQHVGIAERYDLVTRAGGPQQIAGDYLHYNARPSHLSEGSWGIVRVLDHESPGLKKLPGHEAIPPSMKSVCPEDAPIKTFNVIAVDRPMKFNPLAPDWIEIDFDRKIQVINPVGKIYVLEGEKSNVAEDVFSPMPLTLHVNVGDCIKINLKNKMRASRASFSADMLAFNPNDSQGVNVGTNPGDQTVAPGNSRTYTFFAPPEYGETAALVWDWGNFINNVRDGLFGAIIVGPKGSAYRDSKTGEDVTMKNAWQVDVLVDRSLPENANRSDFRDASLFFQDEDNINNTSFMPYLSTVAGLTGVNYRSEAWNYREEMGCGISNLFTRCVKGTADPSTPIILAHSGDPVRIHVFGAFNEGAGGPFAIPGDYVWQNHRSQYSQAGQWGYFRVLPIGDERIFSLIKNMSNLEKIDQ